MSTPENVSGASQPALSSGSVISLADFRSQITELPLKEKQFVVNTALFLLDELYAHLPLKQAIHAVDPVQRLRLLLQRLEEPGLDFHSEMLDIFNSVRDLHTTYQLPEPYKSSTAFLPFIVGEYFTDDGKPHYVVTKVMPGLNMPPFGVGVEITHWNGTPMARAVDANAERQAGSNRSARHIRGLLSMTSRPMFYTLPPLEDWVVITYTHPGGTDEVRFPWKVFATPPRPIDAVDASKASSSGATTLGIDVAQEGTHRARKVLFAPEAMRQETEARNLRARGLIPSATEVSGNISQNVTIFPNELEWGIQQTPSGPFGYLRIRSFNVQDVMGFVNEIIRILSLLPQNGLILDVRANPGGNIVIGQSLLQLFTDRQIEPATVQFRNSAYTLRYTQLPGLTQWAQSLQLAVQTGEIYSQGFPLLTKADANSIGRRYPGKVVLLSDAACYSTTDFFCAGFQDHEIGPILGVDEFTGAGGANVWTFELLRQFWSQLPDQQPSLPLPQGINMGLAFRRTTRVGARQGLPLEDLGVQADFIHKLTRRDLFENYVDLMAKAGLMLDQSIRGEPIHIT